MSNNYQIFLLINAFELLFTTELIECNTNNANISSETDPELQSNIKGYDFECGKRPNIMAIVGGIDAQPNTWPWMAAIYVRVNPRSKPRFICGGAIINNNYILSAAHCFMSPGGGRVRANRFLVRVGTYRLSDTNTKYREIAEIKIHKKYNNIQHYSDIALIRVRNKIAFNPTLAPICLPRGSHFQNRDFVGHRTQLIGWGATRFGGVGSNDLQEVEVNVIDNKDCNRNYSQIFGHESGFPKGINQELICAGFPNGGKDSCQGDSGGPLAMEVGGNWYELGIVSFGYKCAEPGFPGIYTRVSKFVDWIDTNAR